MLRLVKVAVTGGLSCGKSTVCRFFKELGAFTANADEIVHQRLSPSTTLGQQVIHLIGSEIVYNHQIDRALIAKKVFENPNLLYSLEELIHPVVKRQLEQLYEEACKDRQQKGYNLFVAEIPLLFELGGKTWFNYDYSVAVIASPETCRRRFEQAGYRQEDYDRRSARQIDMDEKAKSADFVIINDGTLGQLQTQIAALYVKIKEHFV